MATNEILQFAGTDTGNNLLTQAEYLDDAQRPIGNQPGVARSKLVNKALRQSSLIAAAVAQFIADNQSNNITDSLTPQNIADYMAAVVRSLGIPTAVAGGTADAITADFTPNVALTNGTTVIVRAGAANTTTAPTFAPDSLTAKTIVKGANTPLVAGDIAGAGHWLEMNFDATLDKWVLQNPVVTQASDTRAGIVELATADEAQALASAAVALSPLRLKEALQGSNQSLATSGYQKLPGGLIIQWGTFSLEAAAGSTQAITFPMAFPTALIHSSVSVDNAANDMIGTTSRSLTGMTISKGSNDTTARTGFWQAIGY